MKQFFKDKLMKFSRSGRSGVFLGQPSGKRDRKMILAPPPHEKRCKKMKTEKRFCILKPTARIIKFSGLF